MVVVGIKQKRLHNTCSCFEILITSTTNYVQKFNIKKKKRKYKLKETKI